MPVFSVIFSPGNKAKYSLRSMKQATYCIPFNPCGFLIPQHIAHFCLDSKLTGKNYAANPKIIASAVRGFVPSMSEDIKANWFSASPQTSVQRYLPSRMSTAFLTQRESCWSCKKTTKTLTARQFWISFRSNGFSCYRFSCW